MSRKKMRKKSVLHLTRMFTIQPMVNPQQKKECETHSDTQNVEWHNELY